MKRQTAANSLGWMMLRNLKAKPWVAAELSDLLGFCPTEIASEMKRRKVAVGDYKIIEVIIRRLFTKEDRMFRRASGLAFKLYNSTAEALHRLTQKKRKILRNRTSPSTVRRRVHVSRPSRFATA